MMTWQQVLLCQLEPGTADAQRQMRIQHENARERGQAWGAHIISQPEGEVREQQRNSCGVVELGQGHADALPVAL